jgi:membrane fusion protein (multidrug efflux system)
MKWKPKNDPGLVRGTLEETEHPRLNEEMRMRKKIIIGSAVGVILLGLVFNKWNSSRSESPAAAANLPSDNRLAVKAQIIMPETLTNRIVTTGTVIASEEVELHSEISARLIKIYFKEGSRVAKGDLLLKLNDADLQAQLLKAEAQKKLAESNETRQRPQYEKQLLSQQDYDATLRDVASAKADVGLLRAQIDKTEIRAPFDGVIGLKYVSEGSYITPTTKIATIQSIATVKIDFSIPEKYAGQVEKDSPIAFRIQGIEKPFEARVFAVEPKIDLTTRTLQLRALCTNTEGKIYPGSFANVEFALKQIDRAIMIPTESLVPELKGQKVFLYKNGQAQSRPVKTGIRTDTEIQITDGLQTNDTLIVSGIIQLRQGMAIKITEFQ